MDQQTAQNVLFTQTLDQLVWRRRANISGLLSHMRIRLNRRSVGTTFCKHGEYHVTVKQTASYRRRMIFYGVPEVTQVKTFCKKVHEVISLQSNKLMTILLTFSCLNSLSSSSPGRSVSIMCAKVIRSDQINNSGVAAAQRQK